MTRRAACTLALLAVRRLAGDAGVAPRLLAVVVHKSSPLEGLSLGELRNILLGDLRRWPDHRPIVLIQRDEESAVYQQVLRQILRMVPPDYKRHLMSLEFKGIEPPLIKTLNSDDGAISFVWNVPGAIALVNAQPAVRYSARVKILRIDGKLPGEGGYRLQ